MFFSIITVCLNAARTLPFTLKSLKEQSCHDWEWIVVDGGSEDETMSLVESAQMPGPVKWISEKDSGIYEAMNKGIRMAEGEFVHFLNADDSYADSLVLDHVATDLCLHPWTDWLYGRINVQSDDGSGVLYDPPPPHGVLEEMLCGCLPHQGSFFRRRLFLNEIGFFTETFRTASDYEWMIKACAHDGITMRKLDRVIANFQGSGSSAQLERSLPESFEALNAQSGYWKKFGAWKAIRIYQTKVLNLRLALARLEAELAATKKNSTLPSKL